MVKDVTRSHIKVELDGKTATVPGEMFFPSNGKLGFVVFLNGIKCWDSPHQNDVITKDEVSSILEDIRSNFAKGGHVLEVE
ncbi:hypothetical protein ISP15_17815 [Dyella jejuensis]|uniref:Immunity protein 74 of polymorphic toxin system n=1 Tax=Dyella jejuensis TaxID=1432009 RepID=A0ABW8JM48_9GAMM